MLRMCFLWGILMKLDIIKFRPHFSPENAIAIAAAAVSVLAAFYVAGHRSSASRPSVAFVDFAAVMEQSDAGKSIHKQLDPREQTLQNEAQAKIKELQREQDELNKRRNSLSAEKLSESTAALQKKLADWNAEAQKRDAVLKAAANPAIQKMQQTLREQLANIASENRFTAILPLQDAFYADKELDVTSEAIRRMNEQLPKVEIQPQDEKEAK